MGQSSIVDTGLACQERLEVHELREAGQAGARNPRSGKPNLLEVDHLLEMLQPGVTDRRAAQVDPLHSRHMADQFQRTVVDRRSAELDGAASLLVVGGKAAPSCSRRQSRRGGQGPVSGSKSPSILRCGIFLTAANLSVNRLLSRIIDRRGAGKSYRGKHCRRLHDTLTGSRHTSHFQLRSSGTCLHPVARRRSDTRWSPSPRPWRPESSETGSLGNRSACGSSAASFWLAGWGFAARALGPSRLAAALLLVWIACLGAARHHLFWSVALPDDLSLFTGKEPRLVDSGRRSPISRKSFLLRPSRAIRLDASRGKRRDAALSRARFRQHACSGLGPGGAPCQRPTPACGRGGRGRSLWLADASAALRESRRL